MFLAETSVFKTPEEFEASFQGGQLDGLVLPKPGKFEVTLTRLKIGRVWAQRCSENLERSVNSATSARVPIQFFEDDSASLYAMNGAEIATDCVLQFRPHSRHFSRTSGAFRWATMSLAPSDLQNASKFVADCETDQLSSDIRIMRPSAERLARLRRVHRAVGCLAALQTQPTDMPIVLDFLEQDLIVAMVGCLVSGATETSHRASHRRKAIMDSFRDWLEPNLDRPVHVLEACKALNVPARTLNLCCHDYFGMGPKHYLLLRRMRLARKALLAADESTTVTAVAINLGFWDLSSFAAFYHSIFEELPSATLHRATRHQDS
jgi:AraC-like DNA-binding protein